MKDERQLQIQLNRPNAPDGLEQRIVANWEQQLAVVHTRKYGLSLLATAAAIVMLVCGILVFGIYKEPAVVAAALADIDKDYRQHAGLAIPEDTLDDLRYVKRPPVSMPLKLTKYCTLVNHDTIHLQVDGANKGSVHIFIYYGDFNAYFWQARQGKSGSMYWRIINPRKGLSVLLLHTPDMNTDSVEALVQTMFYV